MIDELRAAHNKIKDLEDRRAKDEATSKKQFDYMMKLEEKVRDKGNS